MGGAEVEVGGGIEEQIPVYTFIVSHFLHLTIEIRVDSTYSLHIDCSFFTKMTP